MGKPLILPPAGAATIYDTLRKSGFETYFCGGCVRDALMGNKPKDFDLTTSATPDEVERLFAQTVPVGKAFGVMVVVEGGGNYEVATFRADLPYADGRHPEGVRFTGAKEDVKRRDFTINALLYDPEKDEVVDHVGGVKDIEQKLLRTVGDPEKRFMEDNLRLLRAVRFAARTGFAIEKDTLATIREMAGLVRTVSGERVGTEIMRMAGEGYARAAFELLETSGLLPHVLPEVALMRGMPQPKKFHPEGDVMEHTLIMLEMLDVCVRGEFEKAPSLSGIGVEMDEDDEARGMCDGVFTPEDAAAAARETWGHVVDRDMREILSFAVLLHDIGKPDTISVDGRIRFNEHDTLGAEMSTAVLERLKRPRKIVDGVHELIRRHMHFSNLQKMKKSKLRRWLQSEMFPLHLELHRLDCGSSHRKLANYEFGFKAWTEELGRPPEPQPLLTGKDLVALGYSPGPLMGEILRAVDDERLEGNVDSRERAEEFVRERFPLRPTPDV